MRDQPGEQVPPGNFKLAEEDLKAVNLDLHIGRIGKPYALTRYPNARTERAPYKYYP